MPEIFNPKDSSKDQSVRGTAEHTEKEILAVYLDLVSGEQDTGGGGKTITYVKRFV